MAHSRVANKEDADMKTFLIALLSLISMPVMAEEEGPVGKLFYEQTVTEFWSVFGVQYPEGARNASCYANRLYPDGSVIQINKDLKDGEFYIFIKPISWDYLDFDPKVNFKSRINFYSGSRLIDGANFNFFMSAKNIMMIRGIKEKPFVETMFKADRMLLIPESKSNITITFDGKAKDLIRLMADCVKKSGSRPAAPEVNQVPSLELPKGKGEPL